MTKDPRGKGAKSIGINMPLEMANELARRAASMNISKSQYCKIILEQWVGSGKKLTLSE